MHTFRGSTPQFFTQGLHALVQIMRLLRSAGDEHNGNKRLLALLRKRKIA